MNPPTRFCEVALWYPLMHVGEYPDLENLPKGQLCQKTQVGARPVSLISHSSLRTCHCYLALSKARKLSFFVISTMAFPELNGQLGYLDITGSELGCQELALKYGPFVLKRSTSTESHAFSATARTWNCYAFYEYRRATAAVSPL